MTAEISGITEAGFEPVRDVFAAIARTRPGVNSAVAAYHDGRLVADLWTGPDCHADTLQAVHSCTKGAAGAVLGLLIQRGLIDPEAPVADYWPEFAAAGKADIPVRLLVSHQAGLVNADEGYSVEELYQHTPIAERLAAQKPLWEPGKGHGYHAFTIGILVDELCRRVTGRRLAEFYAAEIARPYDIELFIGLPEVHEPRVLAGKPVGPMPDLPIELPPFLFQAMNLKEGFPDLFTLVSTREFRAAEIPAANGVGSARGLARLYAACVGPVGDLPPLLSEETVRTMSATQAAGPELVLPTWTAYGMVFQTPMPGRIGMAGPGSFGHDGAGGGMAYGNPDLGLAFGYTTDTPPMMGGCDPVTADLTLALIRCLR